MRFSIVTPVYNKAPYLTALAASLAAQTYTDFEWIVVNDGSTDPSLAVLKKIAEKEPRLTVFSKTNGGVSSARNFGLAAARGDYILFVDGDDMLAPDTLDSYAACIESDAPDYIVGGVTKLREDGSPLFEVHPAREGILAPEAVFAAFADLQKSGLFGLSGGKAIKRSFIKAQSLTFRRELTLAEDLSFALSACHKATTVALLDTVGYLYRQDAGSSTALPNPYYVSYDILLTVWEEAAAFLRHYGTYEGENRTLVEERLTDLACCALAYRSPANTLSPDDIRARFPALTFEKSGAVGYLLRHKLDRLLPLYQRYVALKYRRGRKA